MSRTSHRGGLVGCAVSAALLSSPMTLSAGVSAAAPPLMLAKAHESGPVSLSEYWASEKYDGIRAYWNGESLITRTGQRIRAPAWFTENWPRQPLDGELWIGRGRFEDVLATVRDGVPDELAWKAVRYMVFDLPGHAGIFIERKLALETLLARVGSHTLQLVRHWQIRDEESLEAALQAIVDAGGEGLVLRRGESRYIAGRSDDLLKIKPYEDAEACVTAHLPGAGKYTGMLGALEVQMPNGTVFRIGTGFSDEQRKHPPEVGTCITYRYHGLTANGIPRFARFLRVRPSEDLGRPP
jgi:DNA ligase-1